MVSDRKEAGLGSHSRSVLLSMAGNPGVIALTGQADVTIIAGGSSAASLIELSTNWESEYSKLRWSRSWFAVTKGRSGAVFWEMICSLAVRARPTLLCLVAKSKTFQPEVWMSLVPAKKGVSSCQCAEFGIVLQPALQWQ